MSGSTARPNSSVLRLSDEAVMRFVELCRREECLWNSNIPEYRNRERRQHAITDIAHQLNIEHFTSLHVWLKFRNMRNTYCQELKKIRAGGGEYTPKVIWFSEIDSFLRPHIQGAGPCSPSAGPSAPPPAAATSARSELSTHPPAHQAGKQELESDEDSVDTSSALSTILKREPFSEDEEPAWWTQASLGPVYTKQEPLENTESDDTDLLEPTATPGKRPCENSATTSAKRRRLFSDADSEQIAASLARISEQVQRLKPDEDTFDRFGRYIASLLRSLPRRKGVLLQPQIINLITVSAAFNMPDKPLP